MNTVTRTAIRVGNSIAVTLPRGFVKAGKKLSVMQFNNSLVVRPLSDSVKNKNKFISNEEFVAMFIKLEEKYGEMYKDLANIGDKCLR